MVHSMTGFASKTFVLTLPDNKYSNVAISIKSLNSRFFETTVKLPQGLSHLEIPIIKLLKNKLIRGHVYFTIHVSNSSIFEGPITPAFNTIKSYVSAIEEIKKIHSLADQIKLEHILRLPNIFSIESQELDEQSTKSIMDITDALTETLIIMRRQEGKALAQDFDIRLTNVRTEMEIIKNRAFEFINEWKKKTHEALKEMGADDSLFAETQKNLFYTTLDKIDIHEEITRFNNHLNQFILCLSSPDMEKGKQLDFILQELGREINTINAKCSDSTISLHAINVKVEIEKLRQQIQNIV